MFACVTLQKMVDKGGFVFYSRDNLTGEFSPQNETWAISFCTNHAPLLYGFNATLLSAFPLSPFLVFISSSSSQSSLIFQGISFFYSKNNPCF